MARIVKRVRNVPYSVTSGETQFICGCGLSGNLPFCDGTHKITANEEPGKLYWYDAAKLRHDAVNGYPDIGNDGMAKIS
jgi:CDGSH-type Zn-finger protein